MDVWGFGSDFGRSGFGGSVGVRDADGGGLVVGFRGWGFEGTASDEGPRGGDRVRAGVFSLRDGERERVRWRSERRGGASSVELNQYYSQRMQWNNPYLPTSP